MTATLDNSTRTGDWYLYVLRIGIDANGWRAQHHVYGRRVGNKVQLLGKGDVTAVLPLTVARRCLSLCKYPDGCPIKVRAQEWQSARWEARRGMRRQTVAA